MPRKSKSSQKKADISKKIDKMPYNATGNAYPPLRMNMGQLKVQTAGKVQTISRPKM